MPSSLIFAGLVVLWLLILVPAVARRRQEVERPSEAALAGRVLARPVRHRSLEVAMDTGMGTGGDSGRGDDPSAAITEAAEPAAAATVTDVAEGPEVAGATEVAAAAGATAVSVAPARAEPERPRVPVARSADSSERAESSSSDGEDERVDSADPDEGYAASGYYAYDDVEGGADVPRYEPRRGRRPDERRRDDARGSAQDLADDRAPVDGPEDYADDDYPADRYDDADELEDAHDRHPEDRDWARPPAGFRRGRGGFDAEAAALAARARYAFRQRVVIGLLVAAVLTALIAVIVLPALWWVHGLIDLGLIGYLVYLRRQVRMEEAIRARRAARMAGTRRPAAADDPELDDWARRGRAAVEDGADTDDLEDDEDAVESATDAVEGEEDWTADDGSPDRVRGTGEPVGVLPARRRTLDGETADTAEFTPALPRLQPAAAPPLPAGTQLVDVDEEDEDVPFATDTPARGYRRAAGE